MKLNKKILPLTLLVSTLLSADVGVDSLGVNLGKACVDAKQIDKVGTLVLGKAIDEKYTHAEVYALLSGVFDDKNWKPSINLIYNYNDSFANKVLMLGLNRYVDMGEYNLYGGVLVGMGDMKWKYNPLANTSREDYYSKSTVYAFQVGAEYELTDEVLIGINAKYYGHNYHTSLKSNSTNQTYINHKHSHSISLGLRIPFGASADKPAPIVEKQVEPILQLPPKREIPKEVKKIIKPKPLVKKIVKPTVPVVVIKDTDKDGVLDYKDNCKNTPQGFSVDDKGCEVAYTLEINFPSSSDKILPKYNFAIEEFTTFLVNFPEYKAGVQAHSDSSGTADYNQVLSEKRAKSVYTAILKHGVNKERVSYKGLGETQPIATNKTKEGRGLNRRIEIVLGK